MKLSISAGSTSQTINVWIQDSSSTTGAGLTGLLYNSSGLTAYYALPRTAATAITLATQTVTGAYSSGGFVEISSANMPGWYRFDPPDAAFASGTFVDIHLKGATNMAPLPIEIALTGAADPWTTALPGSYSSGQAGYILGNRLKVANNTVTNVALNNFEFVMVDSVGVPRTGLTVQVQRSIDGGAFANSTNTPATEVSNGVYKINLSAADLNGTTVTLRMTATGAQDRLITVIMVP